MFKSFATVEEIGGFCAVQGFGGTIDVDVATVLVNGGCLDGTVSVDCTAALAQVIEETGCTEACQAEVAAIAGTCGEVLLSLCLCLVLQPRRERCYSFLVRAACCMVAHCNAAATTPLIAWPLTAPLLPQRRPLHGLSLHGHSLHGLSLHGLSLPQRHSLHVLLPL